MTYRPREFWEERLAENFDLRGTGQPGLSAAYNRACYALRREVLDRALADHGCDPAGREVLDVGCGTGFFSAYYLDRGAQVTGVDIAPTSVARLQERHPQARFLLLDIAQQDLPGTFDLVNAFDVLYHITDDAGWEHALGTLAGAVRPGGLLLITDTFPAATARPVEAEHNRMRPLESYEQRLRAAGFTLDRPRPNHVLLNRELGAARFLNRLPGLLLGLDRVLLAIGAGANDLAISKLLVARRAG